MPPYINSTVLAHASLLQGEAPLSFAACCNTRNPSSSTGTRLVGAGQLLRHFQLDNVAQDLHEKECEGSKASANCRALAMPSNSKMLMAATRLMEAPANVASVRSVGIFLRKHRHTSFRAVGTAADFQQWADAQSAKQLPSVDSRSRAAPEEVQLLQLLQCLSLSRSRQCD